MSRTARAAATYATAGSATRSDPGAVLRRTLVHAALCGGILGPRSAAAQQKMSHADAEYQDRPKNGLTCAACSLFRRPRSGEVVEGDISPMAGANFLIYRIEERDRCSRELSSRRTRSARPPRTVSDCGLEQRARPVSRPWRARSSAASLSSISENSSSSRATIRFRSAIDVSPLCSLTRIAQFQRSR
jgi:hypothetical protein